MFKLRRKRDTKEINEKRLSEILKGELSAYIKVEELQGYLTEIEKDREKKKLWDSLPTQKKLKVLRYVLEKRGEQRGKK